ncbi:hypothetical protein Trydic_g22010 [Trypoxylus dichotomus]
MKLVLDIKVIAYLLIAFMVSHLSANENRTNREPRINYGYKANIWDFPYQVSLHYDGEYICSGVIIGEHYALTAAHCVFAVESDFFTIRSGSSFRSSGGKAHRIHLDDIHIPYDYNFLTFDCDIALIYAKEPFISNDSVAKAVLLPNSSYAPPPLTMGLVTGWGTCTTCPIDIPEQFQAVEVPLMDYEICKRLYSKLTERMICASYEHGQKGTLRGDSGGPLVVNGVLVGLVSRSEFPFPMAENPDIYTSVIALSDWIVGKIAELEAKTHTPHKI